MVLSPSSRNTAQLLPRLRNTHHSRVRSFAPMSRSTLKTLNIRAKCLGSLTPHRRNYSTPRWVQLAMRFSNALFGRSQLCRVGPSRYEHHRHSMIEVHAGVGFRSRTVVRETVHPCIWSSYSWQKGWQAAAAPRCLSPAVQTSVAPAVSAAAMSAVLAAEECTVVENLSYRRHQQHQRQRKHRQQPRQWQQQPQKQLTHSSFGNWEKPPISFRHFNCARELPSVIPVQHPAAPKTRKLAICIKHPPRVH